ncbi:MAG: FAD-dependent monooxygenase, partial [Enterobacteriaceae bacterium]
MHSFDVVIAGGGMVGLALACGLRGSGLRVAIIEHEAMPDSALVQQPSLRVSAINEASECFLQQLGAWQSIRALRASAYDAMEVWDQDSFGKLSFSAREQGVSHLGYIIENEVIRLGLWQQVQQAADVRLFTGNKIKQVVWGEGEAFITLDDSRHLGARLVVAADGAHSPLRQQADIPLTFRDYGHHALVATVRTALPHQQCARQIFHGDGILAFLPLCQEDLCSIVWSLPPVRAEALRTLTPEAFNRELAVAFDMQLGLCEVQSERLTFPLTARYARNFAAHRLALVGDAAHTIHPLAGLGVNLGLMDAAELAAELRRLQQEGKDIGQHLYLRRYERRRKLSAASRLAAMQGLRDLFAGSHPLKKF